jgi:hypothetical protein
MMTSEHKAIAVFIISVFTMITILSCCAMILEFLSKIYGV